MASDTVTLVLDGSPSLDDLATALAGLRGVLDSLGAQVARDRPITWTVSALETGSAVHTFLGTNQAPEVVHEVSRRFLEFGHALGRGALSVEGQALRTAGGMLLGILNGRVPSLRLETADDEAVVLADRRSASDGSTASGHGGGAYGAVIGRVQTLSNRGSLRFTLYDQLHDRAVSCYLSEGQEDIMRGVWDRVALVKGWVKRDPASGRPTSVRRIRDVIPREEGRVGDWRHAAGVLASVGVREPAEVTIRRLRDAR